MDRPTILWMDLRINRDQDSPHHYLCNNREVFYYYNIEELDQDIQDISPALLCFEYDYPDILSLSVLRNTKNLYPSVPCIMITEQHSEALAIWALRNHIWDYMVKPLNNQDLLETVDSIISAGSIAHDDLTPHHLKLNPIPAEVRLRPQKRKQTYAANIYVDNHYHEKIYENVIAQLCNMNSCSFSRKFKQENDMTFQNYLIIYRIDKAQVMLKNPNSSVADIAHTVGFHDPSHFTRTFRRIVGMTPSSYREILRRR